MLYKTNNDEFCKKVSDMKVGATFDFALSAEEDDKGEVIQNSGSNWYGVTRLNLFDSDRIIIANYGGNPEYIITLNGCPSDVHEFLWDDMQEVFKDMYQLNKFSDDLVVYVEHKNDTELITEILHKNGWRVENAVEGLEISDGQYTIGGVIKPAPDQVDGIEITDFFAFSSNKSTDGHLVTFTEGYPNSYDIKKAVNAAFNDERKFREVQND